MRFLAALILWLCSAVALAAAALAWALWRAYTFVVRAALVALLIAAAVWGSAWAPIVARNRALFEAYASGAATALERRSCTCTCTKWRG